MLKLMKVRRYLFYGEIVCLSKPVKTVLGSVHDSSEGSGEHAQSRQSLRRSHVQRKDVDEVPDYYLDL